ncbi:tRNA (adenine(58)-N(1))-methyltransferase, mitochondrial isoform X1 [Pungitius pungitius]|uniref:tRNA (adenine(58)-N(1))-methyltransferase, mitochondrial isoform X1 n=1 Tax=Pungitius pungitius TaxID=134920 RepID=UPI002E0ED137
MAAQMPLARLALVHRLLKVGASCQRRLRCKDTLAFSTCPVKCNESTGDSSDSKPPSAGLASGLLSRGRRPLSPLDRISSLLPQDTLSPEVLQLRESGQLDPEEDVNVRLSSTREDDPETPRPSDAAAVTSVSPRPLAPGELLVAEHRRKERVEFSKMFELQTGARLGSSWGVISHDDVAGRPAGSFVRTSRGVSILVRRASLEDYVLYMRRGPAIAYPKDASAMLMMMDVTEGDCVLESGSGSGAMSLFLSRAVGCKGSVLSVEVREDHHKRSVLNYKRWRASWSVRRGEEWPDNVRFHTGDLCKASPLLAAHGFHAVSDNNLMCMHLFLYFSLLLLLCSFVAGGSRPDVPSAGSTHRGPASAPRGRVCRLPRQHNTGHRPAGGASVFVVAAAVRTHRGGSNQGLAGGSGPPKGREALRQERSHPGPRPEAGDQQRDQHRGTASLREYSLLSQTSPRTDEPHSVPGETEEVCAVTSLPGRNPRTTQLL